MTRLRNDMMRQMTPREGLRFALLRTDFSLARRYAGPVLDADPDDADANFGMGMACLAERHDGRAEKHLARALVRRPEEPAIWNNIAVIQYRQGRLAEARRNVLKALALLPDSAEIRETLKQIETAERDAAKKTK
ncbi:MAG: tetratricopeptide repeat protein [Kiritimatiellia bacterium]